MMTRVKAEPERLDDRSRRKQSKPIRVCTTDDEEPTNNNQVTDSKQNVNSSSPAVVVAVESKQELKQESRREAVSASAESKQEPEEQENSEPESYPTKYHALGSAFLELSNGSTHDEPPEPEPAPREEPVAPPVEQFQSPAVEQYSLEEGRPVGQNKVFHADAFCNLCQREFCNKYFLKTHLAVKHNVRDLELELEEARLKAPAPATPPAPTTTTTTPNSVNRSRPDMEDYCDICQKHFCNKYYLKKHKTDVHGIAPDPIPNLQGKRGRPPMSNSMPLLMPPSSTSAGPLGGPLGGLGNVMLLNPFAPQLLLQSQPLLPPSFPPFNPPPVVEEPVKCEVCHKEFSNQFYLAAHQANKHQIGKDSTIINIVPQDEGREPGERAGPIGIEACIICKKEFTSKYNLNVHLINAHNISRPDFDLIPPREKMSQMSSGVSAKMADRVLCELCNKDVCNKYFLKTHKIKVHNMDPEMVEKEFQREKENSVSKTTPEVIPTFPDSSKDLAQRGIDPEAYCHICKKEFCSKYFLKTHWAKQHGGEEEPRSLGGNNNGSASPVSSEGSGLWKEGSPATARVPCEICAKFYCNKYFLRVHMQKKHSMLMDESPPNSREMTPSRVMDATPEKQPEKQPECRRQLNLDEEEPQVKKVKTSPEDNSPNKVSQESAFKVVLQDGLKPSQSGLPNGVTNGEFVPPATQGLTVPPPTLIPVAGTGPLPTLPLPPGPIPMNFNGPTNGLSANSADEDVDGFDVRASTLRLSQNLRRKYQRGRHIRSRFHRLLNSEDPRKMFRCVHCSSRFPSRPECMAHIREKHPQVKKGVTQQFKVTEQGEFTEAVITLPVKKRISESKTLVIAPLPL